MKKALSFILLLSMAAPALANVSEGLSSGFFGWGAGILEKGSSAGKAGLEKVSGVAMGAIESVKNFDKTACAKSYGSSVFDVGSSLFSKVSSFSKVGLEKSSGLVMGAVESAKNFDKNAFVESCKQEPAKPFVITGGVLLGSYITYQLGKTVCQKASKRIQLNKFAKALMIQAESDQDFTLEWIAEVAPKFLKNGPSELKLAINNFMNDRQDSLKTKGLITLVTEFRLANESSKEDAKKAVSGKIERIKKHVLSSSY